MIKLVHEISPVLNTNCQLDCLSQKNKQYMGTAMLREIMGLCFNDEIYFHLSKGLLRQDLLEMLSNQTEISSSSCIVAPSMFLKQIWDADPDYKSYYEKIFANLHDTFSRIMPSPEGHDQHKADNGQA